MKEFLSILTLSALLILPQAALPADKSVIIGFHKRPGHPERRMIQNKKGKIKRQFSLIKAMSVALSEEEIEKLRQDKNVAYISENPIYKTSLEPLQGDEYTDSWGVLHGGAYAAHASGNRGAGVKIAVIDTGIDYNHEDLDDNYRGGYDFVFEDDDPFDDNTRSHGTHVAGIIAAEENVTGVVGVAPEAEIYAVKVMDGGGFGGADWIIAGIEWAVENDMDIANLSLEGPHDPALMDACDSAYAAGLLLVAAGGNDISGQGGPVKYPGAYDSVIAVTATDVNDTPGYFSPVGPELELAAPGVEILSTIRGGTYGTLDGTSQAAPHVAGAAALFFSTNPPDLNENGMLHDEVREMLRATATDLGTEGFDNIFGFGLLNIAAFYCEGDFDCDGDVDGSDASTFKDHFGRSHLLRPCTDLDPCYGDFDCDGDVDGSDAKIFKEDFGRSQFSTPCPACSWQEWCNYP
jgi:subtilisin